MYRRIRTLQTRIILLKLAHGLMSLVGLAPWKLNQVAYPIRGNRSDFEYSTSHLGAAYNVGLMLFITIVTSFAQAEIRSLLPSHPEVQEAAALIQYIVGLIGNIIAVIIILIRIVTQGKMVHILTSLMTFSNKYDMPVVVKSLSRRCCYFLTSVLFLVSWLIYVVICLTLYPLVYIYATFLYGLIFRCLMAEYILVIETLTYFMSTINGRLDRRRLKSWQCPRLIVDDLNGIRRARNDLCQIVARVIDYYASSVLLIIAHISCDCVHSLHWLVIHVKGGYFGYNLDSGLTISIFILVLYPIVFLSASIEKFNREKNRTIVIINNLRLMKFLHEDILMEFNNFSLELLHDNLKFTAHGLIQLDSTLIRSVLTIVITYIIVILQFTDFSRKITIVTNASNKFTLANVHNGT